MDDVLRSDIPLKIEFSIRILEFGNQQELAMQAMVAGFSGPVARPFVFPIFGRGRMIEPLPPEQFEASSVVAACKYMVGECSCVIKALNPGVDLILNTDWRATLGQEVVMVDAAAVTTPTELVIPPGKNEPLAPLTQVAVDADEPVPAISLLFGGMIAVALLGWFAMLRWSWRVKANLRKIASND